MFNDNKELQMFAKYFSLFFAIFMIFSTCCGLFNTFTCKGASDGFFWLFMSVVNLSFAIHYLQEYAWTYQHLQGKRIVEQ